MHPDLIARAAAARENAVAPYSRFKVGAALETKDGRIFTGCNIESASFGLTVCAERVALWKALSETDASVPASPCGACRQLLWEYCGDIAVHLHSTQGLDKEHQLSTLLPHPFDATSL
ncbi:MAG: cytidine deaminase [Acidobacteria bacterium]|nr:MAG: cytidine deaminase [Acidobacteriota bacterium]